MDNNSKQRENQVSDQDRNEFTAWIKKNKNSLIVAGVTISSLILIALGIKNKDSLLKLWNELSTMIGMKAVAATHELLKPEPGDITNTVETVVRTYTRSGKQFVVTCHIRTMKESFRHSAEKAAEAEALGIRLLPNQTIVSSYVKGSAA